MLLRNIMASPQAFASDSAFSVSTNASAQEPMVRPLPLSRQGAIWCFLTINKLRSASKMPHVRITPFAEARRLEENIVRFEHRTGQSNTICRDRAPFRIKVSGHHSVLCMHQPFSVAPNLLIRSSRRIRNRKNPVPGAVFQIADLPEGRLAI